MIENDALLYFYFYTRFFIYRIPVCFFDGISDHQRQSINNFRTDWCIDGGDGEENATVDEITKLTTQEEFDPEETKLQDKGYRRRKLNFKLLDL